MKGFLKKLPVMITFCVVAVALLVFYLVMICRPISYGMKYTYKGDVYDTEGKETVVFENNKKLKMTIELDDEELNKLFQDEGENEMRFYYIRKGHKVLPAGATELEYNLFKELDVIDWDSDEVVEINAFRAKMGEETFTCAGAIVFAVVGGVVEVAVLVFAGLSVYYFVKGKKEAK